MKKFVIGLFAASAILGLGVGARRVGTKMRHHCEKMMATFGGASPH